ncbi:MAG: hypothetical protein JNJ50_11350 [Acidobacteria bacterium]|nr:hypothetical protein [Acidobacteriota bacterium]
MQQKEAQPEQGTLSWWVISITTFLFTIGQNALRSFGVSTPVAIVIVGSLVYLTAYWGVPKPRISFWKWAMLWEYILIGSALAIWVTPSYLITQMPAWLAYGLPVFTVLLGLYALDKVIAQNLSKTSILKWIAGSLGISGLVILFRLFLLND